MIFNCLQASKPDLLLVAMGAPNQDEFIYQTREFLDKGIAIGVGGTFDVWSGLYKRAPLLIRMFGFEWLFRLFQQPQKIQLICKVNIKF